MELTVGHIGVVVQDLSRMHDFYTRVLGLQEIRHALREGPEIDSLLGLTNVKLEVWILGTSARPEAIELLKYHRHSSAPTTPLPHRPGINHIQFVVSDLESVATALLSEGLEFWGPPQDWPDTWAHNLYANDPEGNIIEFSEPRRHTPNPDLQRTSPPNRDAKSHEKKFIDVCSRT